MELHGQTTRAGRLTTFSSVSARVGVSRLGREMEADLTYASSKRVCERTELGFRRS